MLYAFISTCRRVVAHTYTRNSHAARMCNVPDLAYTAPLSSLLHTKVTAFSIIFNARYALDQQESADERIR